MKDDGYNKDIKRRDKRSITEEPKAVEDIVKEKLRALGYL